jgi:cell division protein FtsQ
VKKINFKKILNITLWVLGASALVFTLGFVSDREQFVKGRMPQIIINQDDENSFVDEDDILKFLKDRNDTLVDQPLHEINVFELEKALNAHPSIAKTDVAVNVNGEIVINIIQRKPIVRIINSFGESFYIDNKATLMPLASHFTARVLLVNGVIPEQYSQFYNLSIPQIQKDSALCAASVLDDIYELAKYINSDSLLSDLVTQVYVNAEREIELYPAIGNQKIIFGKADDIAGKFEKLKIFYTEGLNSSNSWDKYSIINLKYKNQVVCTKKQTPIIKKTIKSTETASVSKPV